MTTLQQQQQAQQQASQSALKQEALEQLNSIKRELRGLPHLEVLEKIGQGSFGDIYKVWDSKRGRWAAMKFEKKDKKAAKYSLIKKEAQILQSVKGSRYFAILFDSRFSETSLYNYIEMSFLGPNLESLKKRMSGGKFSLRSVLLIGIQMISGLQVLHEKGIVHRDIKPENFVIGSDGLHHQIYVIDFGLSKYYVEENGAHIDQKQNKGLVGTARYTSINSHLGLEQSRRDDLESLVYLLLYFAKGTLVWQNLQFKDKDERFRKIAELKQTTPNDAMCKGLPSQFLEFLNLVKSLGFTQKPEYDRYRALLSQCYSLNYKAPENQVCYDWCPKGCVLSHQQTQSSATQINSIKVSQSYSDLVANKSIPIRYANLLDDSNNNAGTAAGVLPSKSVSKIMQNPSSTNMPEFKSIMLLSAEQKDPLQSTSIQINNNPKFPGGGVPIPRAAGTQQLRSQQKSSYLFDQINNQTSSTVQNITLSQTLNENQKQQKQLSSVQLPIQQRQQQQQQQKQKQQKQHWEEEEDKESNKNNRSEDEEPSSEFQNGQFRTKHIPIFRVENNDLKYQNISITNMMTMTSREGTQANGFDGRNPAGNGTARLLTVENNTFTPNMRKVQSSMNLAWSSQPMTPKQFNFAADPNSSTFMFMNKENSQYVNNCSNEWNSEQDEKVDNSVSVPFSSKQQFSNFTH